MMRPVFVMSLACAVTSLLALLGLSAVTVIPGSAAAHYLPRVAMAIVACFVSWLVLAFWSRPRQREVAPPRWLRRSLLALGVVYCIGVFLLALG